MNLISLLDARISQQDFAELLRVSEAKVSQLKAEGVIEEEGTALQWLRAYVERLREQAAGRMGEAGGLDLVQERAALARSQRIGHEIKNQVARKTYAPITLLTETVAMASQGVVERFEQLPGLMRKACPDMPEAARDQVMQVIAAARNEWVEGTRQLLIDGIAAQLADADDSDEFAEEFEP